MLKFTMLGIVQWQQRFAHHVGRDDAELVLGEIQGYAAAGNWNRPWQ